MDAHEIDQTTFDKDQPMDTPASEVVSRTYGTSIGQTMRRDQKAQRMPGHHVQETRGSGTYRT